MTAKPVSEVAPAKAAADADIHARRRGRNIAVALCLVGFAALIFWVSVVKMGANVGNPGITPDDRPGSAAGASGEGELINPTNPTGDRP